MALIFNWNDTPDYPIRPANGQKFTLGELRVLVRGRPYMVTSDDEFVLIAGEAGGPTNTTASVIAGRRIGGFAILCKWAETDWEPLK